MNKAVAVLKKDPVLVVAWVLAIFSTFFMHPSKDYLGYIDFKSLGILWGLMVIMQMFKEHGLFEYIGIRLLEKTHYLWQLVAVLVALCFFFSMLITNDVALITFVPFTIMILHKCGETDKMIPVIVLQTIAANLGSMMTPIGNPQNLYLYGFAGLSFMEFIKLVLPYSIISLILLVVFVMLTKDKMHEISIPKQDSVEVTDKKVLYIYAFLFVLAIFVVLRVVPFWIMVIAILGVSFVCEKEILLKEDYALLMTFIGFFIFTGNMGRIPFVKEMLSGLVSGHELLTAAAASQVISNVPAALLLSGFSDNLNNLILGVNFGGLGTLIASMASLISFKLYAKEIEASKGKYLAEFTIINVIFLVILMFAYIVFA